MAVPDVSNWNRPLQHKMWSSSSSCLSFFHMFLPFCHMLLPFCHMLLPFCHMLLPFCHMLLPFCHMLLPLSLLWVLSSSASNVRVHITVYDDWWKGEVVICSFEGMFSQFLIWETVQSVSYLRACSISLLSEGMFNQSLIWGDVQSVSHLRGCSISLSSEDMFNQSLIWGDV